MAALQRTYREEVVPAMMKQFGYKNRMAVPRVEKMVVHTGVGKLREEKQQEDIVRDFTRITGQKPVACRAKQAIASFKTREGLVIGYKVTLRGGRMYDFMERFIAATLPRTRDFRGLNRSIVDGGGNATIGVREHIAFPEMIGEDARTIFGLEITAVTNAKNRKEADALFRLLGFPLEK